MNRLNRIGLFVILLLSLAVPLGMKCANEDLFIAMAAGRDVLNGFMGLPDTWSFASSGQIWVNQAWLSGLLFYESYKLLNAWGPFLIKGALIAGITLMLFVRCLWLGAKPAAAISALSLGLLCSAPFTGIRPDNFGVFYAVALTTFLAAPLRLGLLRYLGALVTMLLWANSHGSFMFGLVLLALKVSLSASDLLFRGREDRESVSAPLEAGAWGLTLLLSVVGTVAFSPFGLQNLVMPFRQVGSEEWVSSNLDWYPLLNISIIEKGWFAPRDVKPFIAALAVAGSMIAIIFRKAPASFQALRGKPLLEILTAILSIAMAFRFRRLVFFAALLLTPSMSFLFQVCADNISRQLKRTLVPCGIWISALLVSLIFAERALIPNLPDDPMLPRMSLPVKQMFWNVAFKDSVEFLRANNISGRILSTAPLSDFLKFHLPAVKVFLDGRAQTIHSLDSLHKYKALLEADPGNRDSIRQSISILKDLGVRLVVLPSNSELDGLKESLLISQDWVGVYLDEYSIIFLPKTATVSDLKYPNTGAEIGGKALSALTSGSKISAEQMLGLAALAQQKPASWVYYLMAQGASNASGCLAPNVREYFAGEIGRLSKMNYMKTNGAAEILRSTVELAGILEQEQKLCPSTEPALNWAEIADRNAELYSKLSREYMPH
jgi:hypothetical protein